MLERDIMKNPFPLKYATALFPAGPPIPVINILPFICFIEKYLYRQVRRPAAARVESGIQTRFSSPSVYMK
ncbi:MAG: hypothetical protein HY266_02775 [Deltaproteobacteria bacterium]|nr:hypothetical protein [Deltaproteobacteria bacterium]